MYNILYIMYTIYIKYYMLYMVMKIHTQRICPIECHEIEKFPK